MISSQDLVVHEKNNFTHLFHSASGKLCLLWYVYVVWVINCIVLFVRCVTCFDCGATTPGVGCQWMSNYTQCGPCASKTVCPVCKIKYNTNDLMIQCAHCERYEHFLWKYGLFFSQASERVGILNPRIWLANHTHVTGPAFYDTARGPDFFSAA